MGDIAETEFERRYNGPFERFGWNRPNLQFSLLPEQLRFAPDYLTDGNFVEVQGVGQDQTLKLKRNKLRALDWWNLILPVHLWVWNAVTQQPTEFNLSAIDALLGSEAATWKTFPEGTPYLAIPIQGVANESP